MNDWLLSDPALWGDSVTFRAAFGFALGAILGSFGTMLAYRLPRGLSIVAPRSHCPSCGHTLSARELVPILSWLSTRGHCRACGAPIGKRYILIETANATLCALATLALGFGWIALPLAYAAITASVIWAALRL